MRIALETDFDHVSFVLQHPESVVDINISAIVVINPLTPIHAFHVSKKQMIQSLFSPP